MAFTAQVQRKRNASILVDKEIINVQLDATTTAPVQLFLASPDTFASLRNQLVALLPLMRAVIFTAGYEKTSDLKPIVSSYVYDWLPFCAHYLNSHALRSLFVVQQNGTASSSSSTTASPASPTTMDGVKKHTEGQDNDDGGIEALLRKETGLPGDVIVHHFIVASEWRGVLDASLLFPVVKSLANSPMFDRSCLQRNGLTLTAATTSTTTTTTATATAAATTAISVVVAAAKAAAQGASSASKPTASTSSASTASIEYALYIILVLVSFCFILLVCELLTPVFL